MEEEITTIMKSYGLKVKDVPPAAGSSDVGNVSYRCPSIQTLLSITDEPLALHTKAFRDATLKPEAHTAMAKGACSLVELTLKVLNDDAFRQKVYNSWKEELEKKKTD